MVLSARDARLTLDAVTRSLVFILKALPWTSSMMDRVTAPPVIEHFAYPGQAGNAAAEVYRPATRGPHPGVVVSLGVVPAGVDHPQRARLGEALARAGFATLLHWSPAMRDLRLDPADIGTLASAYQALLDQPYVDATRSGFLGTCVGGSFALMAAAQPDIRDRLAFVSAYAPYASLWTLARDIASGSRTIDGGAEAWQVDPLVWTTYVRCVTDRLPPEEAQCLRDAYQHRFAWDASKTRIIEAATGPDPTKLSADGGAVLALLRTSDAVAADLALHRLPAHIQTLLTSMSPLTHASSIKAPLIVLLHDRHDHMIPVSESRQLWAVLGGRSGATYTELEFRHLDPTKLSPLRLARELPKLYTAIYPLYRQAAA